MIKKPDNSSLKIPFEGIPSPEDSAPYAKMYYQLVEMTVLDKFGPDANLLQASMAMNLNGNLKFFRWFPDLFETNRLKLGRFFSPTFKIAGNNQYADYLHGLTHIRSRSEHTNLGESLVVPDNLYTVGVRYQKYLATNKEKTLEECELSPFEEFKLGESAFPLEKLLLMNIRFDAFQFQARKMEFYKAIYKEGKFKADFPLDKPSNNFFTQPVNSFEKRLSYNVVRSIFMDEKFKNYSSLNLPFIKTPVSISHKEPYHLVFSSESEDVWIDKIYSSIISNNPHADLNKILNQIELSGKSEEELAIATSKKLLKLLPSN